MIKKITVFLSVLAFASASSVALACDTSSCKGKNKDDKTELSSGGGFDVSGGDCGRGCGKDKDKTA